MKITNIDFYDDEVQEAFEITIESNGETKTFDIRPSDEGFNVYEGYRKLSNVITI